jgi:hypothetical protein
MIPKRVSRRGAACLVAVLGPLLVASCTTLVTDVSVLSSDELEGRQNATAGSLEAQRYLIDRLRPFATGLDAARTGDDAYKQPFTDGTNILGVIRGSQLPNEYVIIGAHYDHLGTSCRTADPNDNICNGATDNASGAAAVLEIGRKFERSKAPPRRSIVFAFWDREEDGLLGSEYYVQHPIVPLAQTVAYVNFDIQGANLLPSLRRTSFAVGAETGGPTLASLVQDAVDAGPIDTHLVSAIFGQGRSDYVNFTDVQVPIVFFSDSTGPCYHSAQDEFGIVDFWKLGQQVDVGYRVTRELADDAGRPAFTTTSAIATFADAVELREVAHAGLSDLGRFTPTQQQQLNQFVSDLDAMVAGGPENFDGNDVSTLLSGAANAISTFTTGMCDSFVPR